MSQQIAPSTARYHIAVFASMLALGVLLVSHGLIFVPQSLEGLIGFALLGFAVVWWIDKVGPDFEGPLLVEGDLIRRPKLKVGEVTSGRTPPMQSIAELALVAVSWSESSAFGNDGQPVVTFRSSDGVRFRVGVTHHRSELEKILVGMRAAGRLVDDRLGLEVERWPRK